MRNSFVWSIPISQIDLGLLSEPKKPSKKETHDYNADIEIGTEHKPAYIKLPNKKALTIKANKMQSFRHMNSYVSYTIIHPNSH